jgi:hypothetical protein
LSQNLGRVSNGDFLGVSWIQPERFELTSVNRLIGLWWLAKIFYPDHFDEDVRALARDFYSLFYHVTPSDADIDRVLDGRG